MGGLRLEGWETMLRMLSRDEQEFGVQLHLLSVAFWLLNLWRALVEALMLGVRI
jgi:hypothetical protein